MATTNNTATIKTRNLVSGINGSGARIWIIQTTTQVDGGRTVRVNHTFSTKAEAEHFLKWA